MEVTGRIMRNAIIKTNCNGDSRVHFLLHVSDPEYLIVETPGNEFGTVFTCDYWKLNVADILTSFLKIKVKGNLAISIAYENGKKTNKLILIVDEIQFFLAIRDDLIGPIE